MKSEISQMVKPVKIEIAYEIVLDGRTSDPRFGFGHAQFRHRSSFECTF